MIYDLMEEQARNRLEMIDKELLNLWINKENAKDFCIEIQECWGYDVYKVYTVNKKEEIWTFIIPNLYFNK